MTRENFAKQVLSYSMEIASSDISVIILFGKRQFQLEQYQRIYISDIMKDVSDNIVIHMTKFIEPSTNFSDSTDHLVRAFMFCFDKSVEIIYNMRVDNDKGVNFNFEELYDGMSGDKIPEYIQIQITKIVPNVISIYQKTFDFIIDLQCDNIDFADKIKSVIYSAIQIGTEYALRIDLDDDSMYEKYLLS